MVRRRVFHPASGDQPSNMQYPPSGSPQPGQDGWQSPQQPAGYQEYAPPSQGSPPYAAQQPYSPPGPYSYQGGESANYYGNPEQPPAYRPAQFYNNSSPSGSYTASPYQQSNQGLPLGPYGYEHPGSNPFGQPASAPFTGPRYDSPDVKHEEGVIPPGSIPQTEDERGLMGALAGAAAGGYAGHKVHHGFLGTLGGAYAGHKLEDAYKDHKKHSNTPSPAPVPAASAPPIRNQPQGRHGNFSASSVNISLDGDHDLIASCANVQGRRKMSSISLNNAITNDDGHFKWQNPGSGPGNFGASARNVRLVDGGRVLEAELRACNGSWRRDTIRLDERIENSNGDLKMT